MNALILQPERPQCRPKGFTLVELMVSVAVGSVVMSAVAYLSYFATRSFVAIGNYSDLDAKSRNTLDVMSREMRQATALLSFQTNLTVKTLRLTNSTVRASLTLRYDANERTLAFSCTSPPQSVILTECDRWDFALYQRTPLVTATNILFYPATNLAGALDASACKLINMSWQCSRQILGQKVNTETVQSSQIVLRNKN
jgi:prepilin-type N-terminal cleavage/methylation domain-containing protein